MKKGYEDPNQKMLYDFISKEIDEPTDDSTYRIQPYKQLEIKVKEDFYKDLPEDYIEHFDHKNPNFFRMLIYAGMVYKYGDEMGEQMFRFCNNLEAILRQHFNERRISDEIMDINAALMRAAKADLRKFKENVIDRKHFERVDTNDLLKKIGKECNTQEEKDYEMEQLKTALCGSIRSNRAFYAGLNKIYRNTEYHMRYDISEELPNMDEFIFSDHTLNDKFNCMIDVMDGDIGKGLLVYRPNEFIDLNTEEIVKDDDKWIFDPTRYVNYKFRQVNNSSIMESLREMQHDGENKVIKDVEQFMMFSLDNDMKENPLIKFFRTNSKYAKKCGFVNSELKVLDCPAVIIDIIYLIVYEDKEGNIKNHLLMQCTNDSICPIRSPEVIEATSGFCDLYEDCPKRKAGINFEQIANLIKYIYYVLSTKENAPSKAVKIRNAPKITMQIPNEEQLEMNEVKPEVKEIGLAPFCITDKVKYNNVETIAEFYNRIQKSSNTHSHHRSPRRHYRRGHWRVYRKGRADQYKRWVEGCIVNADMAPCEYKIK